MKRRCILLGMVFIALFLRLLLAIASYGHPDVESYMLVASIVREGGNVYALTTRYNYSPVWFHILHLLDAGIVYIPITVRVFLSLIDMLNVHLVFRIAGMRAALLYALSPAAILVAGYQGQFETLAMLPFLLALLVKEKRLIVLCGVLCLLIKHNTVFLVWVLFIHTFGVRRSMLWVCVAVLLFLASFIPYLPEGSTGIAENVFAYTSIVTAGVGVVVPRLIAIPVFYVVMFCVPLLTSHWRRYDALAFIACVQLLVMPGIGYQYFIPALLLLSIAGEHRHMLIISVANAYFTLTQHWKPVYFVTALAVLHLFTSQTTLRARFPLLKARLSFR